MDMESEKNLVQKESLENAHTDDCDEPESKGMRR